MKTFNTKGSCDPNVHYTADISDKLEQIGKMIDGEHWFIADMPHFFGKTTVCRLLADYLRATDHVAASVDIMKMGNNAFVSDNSFTDAIIDQLLSIKTEMPPHIISQLEEIRIHDNSSSKMYDMFCTFKRWCRDSAKPVVLLIDGCDTAYKRECFMEFMTKLRSLYNFIHEGLAFRSVIFFATENIGMYKRDCCEEGRKIYPPWNIDAGFTIDMSFSPEAIKTMLVCYAGEHGIKLPAKEIARRIYDLTFGNPFLVSRICEITDAGLYVNELSWSLESVDKAVRTLISEKNDLWQLISEVINSEPKAKRFLRRSLNDGYYSFDRYIAPMGELAKHGLIKSEEGSAVVSNKVFEMWLDKHIPDEGLTRERRER